MPYPEYLIIGAGTIGCSLAYQLSVQGKSVTVLEDRDTAFGAAGASGSLVGRWGYDEGPVGDFVGASIDYAPQLVEELQEDVGWKTETDYLQVISNDMEMKIAEILLKKYVYGKVRASIVDITEARKYEPAVSAELPGAILIPDMNYFDPIKLAFAFRRRAAEHGAVFINEAGVTELIMRGGTCVGARTRKGDHYAGAVVLCAGSWSAGIAKTAGLELPVKPFRSEMMVTEPTGPLINGEIGSCTLKAVWYFPELITDERVLKYKLSFAIEQTDTGTCIIHGSREDAGFNVIPSPSVLELLLKTGYRIVPALRDLRIIRSFCGLRPVSEDNLPYMGAAPSVPGLFLCTGHGASGITMSAVTGKAMAEYLICGKARITDISAFDPSRIGKAGGM